MAFDETLATRLRAVFAAYPGVVEKRMFGGLAFMLRGHMCCGVNGRELMVRVGPEGYQEALARPHAREMDFTGRAMKGFVCVAPEGVAAENELEAWVKRGARFVLSLPPK